MVSLDTESGQWDEWFDWKDLNVIPQAFQIELPVLR